MTQGIDISSYQRGLDLKKAQASGVKFAILRGGYTGYGAERTKRKDACFEAFYEACKAVSMPCGVYYYSCAKTRSEGIQEAEFLYQNCLKGKVFEYPIYIDVENPQWQSHDKSGVTDAIIGFCETLEAKGFYTGVYASKYWFDKLIDSSRLKAYTKWVAAWSPVKPDYKIAGFDLWQYSNHGNIGGIEVDMNESFKDFPKIIKKACLNGYAQKEAVQKEYTVQKWDTLTKIAKQYGTTVPKLKKANGIENANLIRVGQKIKIV